MEEKKKSSKFYRLGSRIGPYIEIFKNSAAI